MPIGLLFCLFSPVKDSPWVHASLGSQHRDVGFKQGFSPGAERSNYATSCHNTDILRIGQLRKSCDTINLRRTWESVIPDTVSSVWTTLRSLASI